MRKRRPSRRRDNALRRAKGLDARALRLERLETRVVLTTAVISEFMAVNGDTLVDEDDQSTDWIEVYNPGPDDLSLDGWYLTDDAADQRKWAFPSEMLGAGSFLVVQASNKDRTVAGAPLHTNFKLTGDGEYLALTFDDPLPGDPGHIAVATEFFPNFPKQHADVSYGPQQSVTSNTLIAESNASKIHFPTDNSLGASWTEVGFNDTGWTDATAAVGYEVAVPGFTVHNYKANLTVDSLADAENVISTPAQQVGVDSEIAPVINYLGTGGQGHFFNDVPFPGSFLGEAVDDFVVEATATVTIPLAGNWTFGVNSDDGFSLDVGSFHSEFNNPRAPGDTLATFNFPAPGTYPLRLLMYERGGGAEVELFAKSGSFSSYDSGFLLVGDTSGGGLTVETDPSLSGVVAGFSEVIQSDVEAQMHGTRSTAMLRTTFEAADPAALSSLALRVRYDDGFVAYLNGVEIARRNAPAPVGYDSIALSDRPETDALTVEHIDISQHLGLLQAAPAGNVLAVMALNDAADSDQFLIAVELAEVSVIAGPLRFFSEPTPGDFNSTAGFVDFVSDVTFSQPHGFYDAPFSLSLASQTAGAQVRYTTDGSQPTETQGTVYTAPINVSSTSVIRAAAFKSGFQASDATTASYVFLDDVITQSGVPGAGWPSGSVNGQVIDYGMDPDVVNDPLYSSTIKDDLLTASTISIVMDTDDLFDSSTGIYVNAGGEGRQWERPASIELISPDGSESGFQVNAGIRIRGGFSRSDNNPKHAFRLFFRREYGPGKLNYAFFGDEGVDEFDGIDLRTSQNYSWSFQGDSRNTMNRDVFSRDTQRDMGQPYTRSRYHHLYINGQYWGLFQSQERAEASFAASYFGGVKEDYDVIKAEAGPYTAVATDGNMQAWQEFWEGANEIAATADDATRFELYQKLQGLDPDGARNAAFPVQLDAENLIDYMLVIIYGGNLDAPISNFLGNTRVNNFFSIRNRTGEEGWRFFAHDSEHTLLSVNQDRTGPFPAGDQFQYSNPQWIFQQLWSVEEFRLLVADRVQKYFFNGGLLTPEVAAERFMARADEIDRAIVGESARWGDAKRSQPFTRNAEWLSAVNNIVNNYFPQRSSIVVEQLRGDGLISTIEPPIFSQHGGTVPDGFAVEISASDGAIYYTLDGSDPRLPGGAVAPGAIAYNAVHTLLASELGTTSRWIVPSGAAGENGWQNLAFNDTAWNAGTVSLGFDTGGDEVGGGFAVRVVDTSSGDISSIGSATALLDGSTGGFTIASDTTTVLPYVNLGDSGNLSSPAVLAMPGTSDREQYALRATAEVTIPVGTWTVAVGSDDGFRLTMPGVSFSSKFNTNGDPGNGTDTLVYSAPRAHGQTGGTFTVSGAPLTTTVQLDFYERGGGDSVELSVASGTRTSFSSSLFDVLQDGLAFGADDWAVRATVPSVDFAPLITTDLQSQMHGSGTSAYVRIPFAASNVEDLESLVLALAYDDGFVAYLNGTQIAQRNAPASPAHSSAATGSRPDSEAIVPERIDVSAFKNLLVNGANVLAIHGMNLDAANPDFLIDARLEGFSTPGAVTLTDSTLIRTRALADGQWSALNEAEFFLNTPADATKLAITEINYNPADPTAAELALDPMLAAGDFEFIELVNTSAETIDLRNVSFADGILFTFTGPTGIALAPGEHVVVAKNLPAFRIRYGDGPLVAGEFTSGSLSNGGEQVTLRDRFGGVIRDFTYNDAGSWPGRADGKGSTLEIVDSSADYNNSDNWRSSHEYGGSPGFVGSGPVVDIVVNEVLTHTDPPAKDAVELHNSTAADIDISGWWISDSSTRYDKFVIPAGTVLAAGGYMVIDEDDFNPTPGVGNSFALDAARGDDVWLLATDAAGLPVRFAEHAEFGAAANGESFGRWPNAAGRLVPMQSVTLGAANSGPRIGPVIISELMYHPLDPTANPLLLADFDAGADGFSYVDDPFNGTSNPTSADGDRSTTGGVALSGALHVILGPGDIVNPVSAGWRSSFNLAAADTVTVSLSYRMVMGAGFESNEFGEVILEIDGTRYGADLNGSLLHATGDGNGGADVDFGWRTTSISVPLADGAHQITFGAYNNDATAGDEFVEVFFDDMIILPSVGPDDDLEYVELYNTLETAIDLDGWRLDAGVQLAFSGPTVVGPQQTLLAVRFDPSDTAKLNTFRSHYGIDASVAIVGGYAGKLDNGGERVELLRPDAPPADDPLFIPLLIVDSVRYDDVAPWPTSADGAGDSLQRNAVNAFGDFASSWSGLPPTPGATEFANPNTPPTITAITDVTIDEDTTTGLLGFSVGDAETAAGSLAVSVATSNATLVPLANILISGVGANRSVTVTPAADLSGTADIMLTVTDGLGATAETTFTVNVTPVNDLPTITPVSNVTIDEDTPTGPLTFTIGDVETASGALTVTAATSNATLVPLANIVITGVGAFRNVTVTPVADLSGSADITLTVTDGLSGAAETAFTVTVTPVNDPPTITPIADLSIDEDTSTGPLAFTVGDLETAAGALTVVAATSNATLLPLDNIVVTGDGASREVTITPEANLMGTVDVTLTVTDSAGGKAETTFTVNVTPVNDQPAITSIAHVTIDEDTSTGPLAFSIGDAETAAGSLIVTAATSDAALAPLANIAITGTGANRDVTVMPAANLSGSVDITLTVADGSGATVDTTFTVTVTPVNDLPTITPIGDVTIDEDSSTGPLAFTIGDVETAPESLTVTAATFNTTLVPPANIVITGAGPQRQVEITPASGENGTAIITLTVTDLDGAAVQTSFALTVTPTPAVIGDTNGDGVVDIVDLNNVRNQFGATGEAPLGDTNGDGVVDIEDLNNVRNHFGESAGAQPLVTQTLIQPTTMFGQSTSTELGRTLARPLVRRRVQRPVYSSSLVPAARGGLHAAAVDHLLETNTVSNRRGLNPRRISPAADGLFAIGGVARHKEPPEVFSDDRWFAEI